MSVLGSIAKHASRVLQAYNVANPARQEDSTDGWQLFCTEGCKMEAFVAHSGV